MTDHERMIQRGAELQGQYPGLARTPALLFVALLEARHMTLSYDLAATHLRNLTSVYPTHMSLQTHMRRLRQTMTQYPAIPYTLKTLRMSGMMLVPRALH
jgi:DNA-binding response OmpR family regulator